MTRFCMGFPYCKENVEEDCVACNKCWFKISRRMRHELLAVTKHWKDTPRYRQVKREAEKMLHARLRVTAKREEERLRYTVVG